MKANLVKFLVLAILAILLLGSCATHHSCEAYADSHYKGGIFATARW